jgi:energy-coupling factor transport system permease protein
VSAPPPRLHPFTPFILTIAVTALAFLLPGPWGPPLLYAVVVVALLATGSAAAVRRGVLLSLLPWLFLFLLHGVLGQRGPTLASSGLAVALAQGGRFGAIVTATLALTDAFDPSRFLDAVAARGWSFASAFLLVATLQAAPRLVARAHVIAEAQRARGLRRRGSLRRRLAAVPPLVFPLVLGAVAELDERAMALESRAIEGATRRTPLAPTPFGGADFALTGIATLAIVAASAWLVFR